MESESNWEIIVHPRNQIICRREMKRHIFILQGKKLCMPIAKLSEMEQIYKFNQLRGSFGGNTNQIFKSFKQNVCNRFKSVQIWDKTRNNHIWIICEVPDLIGWVRTRSRTWRDRVNRMDEDWSILKGEHHSNAGMKIGHLTSTTYLKKIRVLKQ